MKKALAEFAIILFLIMTPVMSMAEVSVTLKLDRSEATLDDTIKMLIKISGTRSTDSRPVLHGLEQFTVTQGGTSTRVEIINGKVNAGIDYTYFIQPKKTGNFRIGPAEIKVEGKILKSNIAMLAVKAPSKRSGTDRGPLFIEAGISSHDVYVEEQCIYTMKLYRRTRVSDLSLNLPNVEHMVFKQLGEPLEYQSTYGGVDYQVLEIRYAILPSREGVYTIGPSRMNMTVLQPDRRSPFGNFFKDPFFKDPFFSFSSGRPLTLTTAPLELKVHPLPEQGKPADFSGLVGDFHMESTLEPASIKAGESATLTVQVSGRGNVNRIPDLKLPEMHHTKIYADQPVLNMKQDDKGLGGTKVMKWALVPKEAGQMEIPPLELSFFDAEREEYRVLNTPSHTLSVLPGERQAVVASTAAPKSKESDEGPVKKEIQELGKDILPIHTAIKDLSVSYRPFMTGWFFWLALFGPFSVYMMAFFTLKLRKQSPEQLTQLRSKKALKELTKQCQKEGLSYLQLIDAVKDYLNNRFNLSIGVLTAVEAERILRTQGVRAENAESVGAIVRKVEDAVYTGKGQDRTDLGNDVYILIKAIEKEIP
ncbi:MAG: protein BatD [Deltaproteobacteria bacterium]|nr:protein BatD [Deltaproteobacteria bacterium]